MALESIASAKLFVNKVLIKIQCEGITQLEINFLSSQDDFSIEIKVGVDKMSR